MLTILFRSTAICQSVTESGPGGMGIMPEVTREGGGWASKKNKVTESRWSVYLRSQIFLLWGVEYF